MSEAPNPAEQSVPPSVRPAALAGAFYPAEPEVLADLVDCLVAAAPDWPGKPKAIVAPHAGYVYSGPVAGNAYAALRQRRDEIRRVVILGPCHRVPVRGFAIPSHSAFETPLGRVPLEREALDRLLRHEDVEVSDEAHALEHCLETQLPFLQRLLKDSPQGFAILPIIVGAAPAERTEAILEELWGGPETLIVVSSDLSHFHAYDEARVLDLAACQAIESLAPERLGDEQACGRYPIKGLLRRARALDLRATTLDLRSSGDTAGRDRRDRVVGYAAIAFEEAARACLPDDHRRQLLAAAGKTVARGLRQGGAPQVALDSYAWPLRAQRASFVTLKLDGRLRGCVGSIQPHQPMISDVVGSAYKAAFGDRRFRPLESAELEAGGGAELSVSILSHPRRIEAESESESLQALEPGRDGVILRERGSDRFAQGLFLPQVWEALPEPADFLRHLKQKAGLAADHWSDDLQLFRFRTESFGDRLQAGPPSG